MGRGTIRRMVEGVRHLLDDKPQCTIQVLHHVRGHQAYNPKAALAHVSVTSMVALWTVAIVMRRAVNFENKTGLADKEISDVGPDGMLPPNLEAKLAAAKLIPKQHLW